VAQTFVISGKGHTITEISPYMRSIDGGGNVRAMVTDMIGAGTTVTDVLFDAEFSVTNSVAQFVPFATNFFLDPGTYFLTLSTLLDSKHLWATTDTNVIGSRYVAIPGTEGVNASYPPASSFLQVFSASFGLQVSGTPVPDPNEPVPEPAPLHYSVLA
jgi:hypothetical protein